MYNVVDLENKEVRIDKINQEKMAGHFKLKLPKGLIAGKRVQQFSNDKMVYHMHKNRTFLRKLWPRKSEQSTYE